MGYRSDVYMAFRKTLLPIYLAKVDPEVINAIEDEADTYSFFENDEEWCIIIYECVKWYNSYPECRQLDEAFQEFLNHDEEDFQYLRIGEEWDDVETFGYANRFHISRHVHVV